ncbi:MULTISPECIES: hypothetical protein [Clostridium]|uniref:Uncharacterized protein n=1 Tax=Clostridium cibarium TaxID=2762247 RepID=A0ABR8PUP5_9CLOT|nr:MULTISPECIES: hypothetical protein [Clostridium]MBD7911892.1 hypothetical protein [Clostridium cibarium]
MNKEKIPSNKMSGDYPIQEIPVQNTSGPSDSDVKIFKRLYLPNSKANYSPSEKSIEKANDLESLPSSRTIT